MRAPWAWLSLLLLPAMVGCACGEEKPRRNRAKEEVEEPAPRRTEGSTAPSARPSEPPSPTDSDLIYLVNRDDELYAFDPRTPGLAAYRRIGTLDCSTKGRPTTMGVDRHGYAWVFYDSGELFRASVRDASCTATTYVHRFDDRNLGMGFTADLQTKEDRLYILAEEFGLGTIATGTLTASVVGKMPDGELSGSRDGKLYHFEPPQLGEVDLATRTVRPLHRFTSFGEGGAYAFARYGNSFFVFTAQGANTQTTELDVRTSAERIRDNDVGFRVVGAGQSTLVPPVDRGQSVGDDFPPPP